MMNHIDMHHAKLKIFDREMTQAVNLLANMPLIARGEVLSHVGGIIHARGWDVEEPVICEFCHMAHPHHERECPNWSEEGE